MRSTTSNLALDCVAADTARFAPASVERGLTVLLELIRYGRLARGKMSETAALVALETIHARRPLTDEDRSLVERLRSELDLAREKRVERLISQLRSRRRFTLSRTPDRAILLLVLSAKVLATGDGGWPVLATLQRRGFFGRRAACEQLLVSVFPRVATKRSLELAKTYLRVAANIARLDLGIGCDETPLDQFQQWHWARRLAHLVTRAGLHADNPHGAAVQANTLEFELARRRGFHRLRQDGGRVARKILQELGYRDNEALAKPLVRSAWGLLLALVVGSLLAGLVLAHRHATWDRSVDSLVRQALGSTLTAQDKLVTPDEAQGESQ